MARELTVLAALREALDLEMDRDDSVVLFGEDIVGGAGRDELDASLGDAWGGPFGVTKGLGPKYGRGRVVDTQIAETGFVGASIGAAFAGLRPVAELMYVDFLGACYDQLINQASKLRYVYGAKTSIPMVLRTVVGAGFRAGNEHSQTFYPLIGHIPGLKAVAPSNPADAKGLLAAAIRDDDPVVMFEHKRMYMRTGVVPEESYTIPIGVAATPRQGRDVTIVALQRMVPEALDAAETLADNGIDAEVIDLRSVSPLDERTVLDSVARTGRLVIADESYPRHSVASEISSIVAEHAFGSLLAPIAKVLPPNTPVPFSPPLEDAWLPSAPQILEAVQRTLGHDATTSVGSSHA